MTVIAMRNSVATMRILKTMQCRHSTMIRVISGRKRSDKIREASIMLSGLKLKSVKGKVSLKDMG